MNEILKMLNALKADELEGVIMRANIMLEKKRKDEAEEAIREQERLRQEKIEQEKRRQEQIAELQRQLQELQHQSASVQEEAPAPKNSTPPPAPQIAQVACPHCRQLNAADSLFCGNCGQRMSAPQAAPAPAAQPKAGAQVRYADNTVKKWEMLPGEQMIYPYHEIKIRQPDLGQKHKFYMEVTNQRILLTRIGAVAASAGVAFGLVGSLVREAAGAGPRPWLEIPLTAVTSCGLQDDGQFFFVADQIYVLKNKKYEKTLPQLVANAKKARS